MIVGGLSPLNRVHEILQRMIDNPRHIESLKTCCGVLAILSRDEANKQLIARDGVRLICSIMDQHIERHDLLEAACDLLWSLAFNNTLLKEVIGQQGAIPVILRGMNLHPGVADFLKSACGALSNMCQNPANQSLISADGGIQCMLGVLEHHRQNVILLPFVFDALASLIVGNQDNGRRLSDSGAIVAILSLMEQHLNQGELVKSGCHALAILSDNRGEGAKIAAAGGVKVLLPVLRMHPSQVDLHRVAAVVLLRMLQEAPVAAEMARNHGVPLMLNVLYEQMNEVETVAAGCHILYSITHAEALKGPPPIDLESQFQMCASSNSGSNDASNAAAAAAAAVASSEGGTTINGRSSRSQSNHGRSSQTSGSLTKKISGGLSSPTKRGSVIDPSSPPCAEAGTLALVLAKHTARKDVARACVRSVINLSRFTTALWSFVEAGVLEPILCAVSLHPGARDITEGALTMLKLIGSLNADDYQNRQDDTKKKHIITGGKDSNGNTALLCSPLSPQCVSGMLACVKARPGDATAATIIFRHLEAMLGYNPQTANTDNLAVNGSQGVSVTASRRNSVPKLSSAAASGTSNGGSSSMILAAWEQEGVKVCLTWARLHSQSTSAPTNRTGSGSSVSNDNKLLSSGTQASGVGSSGSTVKSAGSSTKHSKSSVDAKALASALSALCRFLQGFASRLPPGLAALRMLDTSTIVRNLESRVRVELNGEIDSEVRRSVNMLLVLLGSPPPPAISPAAAAAASAAAAAASASNTVSSITPSATGSLSSTASSNRLNGLSSSGGGEATTLEDESSGTLSSSRAYSSGSSSVANSGVANDSSSKQLKPGRSLKIKDINEVDSGALDSSTPSNKASSKVGTPKDSNSGFINNGSSSGNSVSGEVASSGTTTAESSKQPSKLTKAQRIELKNRKANEKSGNGQEKDGSLNKNYGCVMVDADMVDSDGFVVSEMSSSCRCKHGHRSHVLQCQSVYVPMTEEEEPMLKEEETLTNSNPGENQVNDKSKDAPANNTAKTYPGSVVVDGEDGKPRRVLPKRPRPIHPIDQGVDRVLLWTMPPHTEPISPTNCGDPDSAAILAEENDEPSVRRCHVVYDGCDAAGMGLPSKVSVHEPYIVPHDTGIGEGFKHSLTFDACFESGNLAKAIQRGDYEYDLFLRPDIHTEGHMQWFYFAVANTHPPNDIIEDDDPATNDNPRTSKLQAGSNSGAINTDLGFGVGATDHIAGLESLSSTASAEDVYHYATTPEAKAMVAAMLATPPTTGGAAAVSSTPSQLDVAGDIIINSEGDKGEEGIFGNEEEEDEDDEEEGDLVEITFNVVNLTKPDSLFNHGMQPLMFDTEEAKETGQGWYRAGYDISYFANNYNRKEGSGHRDAEASATYFTLSFTVTFSRSNSTYLLTNSYPYTYSDHKHHLSTLLASNYAKRHMTHAVLCQTLGELECDLVTITEDGKDEVPLTHGNGGGNSGGGMMGSKRKKCIVITGRVHPGETQASWMMKGVLDFLTGDSPQARLLRSLFVFKIVPMLNPDGVMYGSNRCSLAGCDLNRAWKKPSRSLHPTIYFTKALIRTEKALRDVVLYIDLHGHSRKMNVFMYGCDDKKKPRPMTRIFPKLLSWNVLGKKYLSFQDCSFSMRKGRESTARVVVAKELGILNSYTLEGTFAGPNFGPLKDTHMNGNHFQEMGHALCDSILDYYIPNRENGLLSEEAGLDGISLSARCAHSTHKHAKSTLRRYKIPSESSAHQATSSSSSAAAESDSLVPGPKGKKEEGDDECEGDGLGGKGKKGTSPLNGNNSDFDGDGNESPSDDTDKENDACDAPPSPEVLDVATDADGSPSNTKVLEALLSDESSKDAVRRRSSANSKTNSGLEIDIVEEDECDDIDSGSDNDFDDNGSVSETPTPMNNLDIFSENNSATNTSDILANTAEALSSSCDQVAAEIIEEELIGETEVGTSMTTTTTSASFDSIHNGINISTSSRKRIFRRRSSSSNIPDTVPDTVPGTAPVVYPQLVPSTAPLRNTAFDVESNRNSNSGGGGGGGGSVLLPRSIARGSSGGGGGGGSDSMWNNGGGGSGGGSGFWADSVQEKDMLNNKRPSLLAVGTKPDGTSLRPKSGSRYRQQLQNSPPKGLIQLGLESDQRSGFPSVGLNVTGSSQPVGGDRLSLSRPPRASVGLMTRAASLPTSNDLSIVNISSRGPPPAGPSYAEDSDKEKANKSAPVPTAEQSGNGVGVGEGAKVITPRLSRSAALNVMRGSLRVKDTSTSSSQSTSAKVPKSEGAITVTSHKQSMRRSNSSHGPKGSSTSNGRKKGSKRRSKA